MAKAEICAGICGFTTTVEAHKMEDGQIALKLESECKAIQRLGSALAEVDPFREFTFREVGS